MLAKDQHGETNINLHNTVFDFWRLFFLVDVFFIFIVLSMGENFWFDCLPSYRLPPCPPSSPSISGYVECCFPRFQAALQTDAPVWMSESRWKQKSKKNLNRSLPTSLSGYRKTPIEPCIEYGFVRATRVGGPFSKCRRRFLGRNQCGWI